MPTKVAMEAVTALVQRAEHLREAVILTGRVGDEVYEQNDILYELTFSLKQLQLEVEGLRQRLEQLGGPLGGIT